MTIIVESRMPLFIPLGRWAKPALRHYQAVTSHSTPNVTSLVARRSDSGKVFLATGDRATFIAASRTSFSMTIQNVLIAGRWRAANAAQTFRAENPRTKEPLPDEYPVSSWTDCDGSTAGFSFNPSIVRAYAKKNSRCMERW